MTTTPPRHITTNNGKADGALNSADEPCPAIGANLIALMTNEARERLEARFWTKTEEDPETGCLMWTRGQSTGGYGMFRVTSSVTAETHRVAYVLAHGPISDNLVVRHSCNTPACLRHLKLGTHADNSRDMREAGRGPSGPGSNPRKLTAETALMILGDYILGVPAKEIASDLGVSRYTVWRVSIGHTHVAAITAHVDAWLAAEAAEQGRRPPAE